MDRLGFSAFVNSITRQLEKMYIVENDSRFSRKTTPTDFEKLVVEASKIVIQSENIKCKIDYTEGGHAFPDIVFTFGDKKSYGIEVKTSTQANASETSWITLGNSILGTTRVDVDDLYIIFIKVGDNGCFIKGARYEDSVSDVAVTHSPRYKLDLNQSADQSFFSKSGISYDEMKKSENPIGLVTDYFKDKGLTAWWIAESTPAIIKNWNELSLDEKDEILSKSLILFPEIIYSQSSEKYKRLSKWLVANYSVVDSSLRDRFSAGGRATLTINGKVFSDLPKIFETFHNLSEQFILEIKNVSSEDLEEFWNSYNLQNDTLDNRLIYWKDVVAHGFCNDSKRDIYLKFLTMVLSKVYRP
ncbi:MAG: hypothetical protein ACOX2M_03755 [Fastidiosipilaceae bacterium]|jgi:hypothetical protein